jgi:Flp pilus assembly protein TadD
MLRLKPDNARAHFNLGCLLAQKGDQRDALAEIRAAIELQPDDRTMHEVYDSLMKQVRH